MIRRLALLLVAGFALPRAALAQPALDPAALDLARVLLSRDETLYDDGDLRPFQARIENRLLASEGACNAFVPECRAAATQVAREYAPAYRRLERERTERITAYLLADTLRPDEMVRIGQYLRGDEGRRFLDALALLREPERTEQRRRELERSLARTGGDTLAAARASFRQRTRNLARPAPR
jgi:hypothetical protein